MSLSDSGARQTCCLSICRRPIGRLALNLAIARPAQDALTRVFVCADRRDWDGLGAVLGERVVLDYASLTGGEPAELSGDELLAAWRGALGGFEATQHWLGSFLIEIVSLSEAWLRFYGIATQSCTLVTATAPGRPPGTTTP